MSLRTGIVLLFALPHFIWSQNKLKLVEESFVYKEGKGPTPECHASTIASTKKGIALAWFGGTHEKNKDVVIWFSKQQGKSWSKPKEIANGIINASLRYPCWNPVLFQDRSGPLYLFYKVGPSPVEWWGMMMQSTNGGQSWSKPERIPVPFLGPIKNKPVEINSVLFCPSSTEHEGWKIQLEKFDLVSKKWIAHIPIRQEDNFEVIQPVIFNHPDGKIQFLNRSKNGAIIETWSTDQGLTWSPLKPTSLPNPNSGIDGLTLSNGKHLLIYNHTGTPPGQWGGDRYPLNVAISSDGQDWKAEYMLENMPGEFSYPAVIQSKDGLIHLCYTYNRKTIKYVKLKPED